MGEEAQSSLPHLSKRRLKRHGRDFPGGAVVKNPPTNAGDMDSWSGKIPYAVEQLSPCATTTEARVPRACAPQQENPLQ